MCEKELLNIVKYKNEGNRLKYPKIELTITGYEDISIDEYTDQNIKENEEILKQKELEKKRNKKKKEHDKINKDLKEIIELHNKEIELINK